jgi:ATP-dependent DNA ligase
MYCKTIYKKDSSGKIRYLTANVAGDALQQISGLMYTINPIVHSKICVRKNIGKSNETTAAEQAELEAAALVVEKLRTGYFYTIDEANEKGGGDFLLPMLAKDYKKEFKKVTYPCFAQPKLDGMRSLGSDEDTLTSRTGKVVDTIKHIKFKGLGDNVLDGELYAHGKSFQEVMRLVKKYRPGLTEEVKYHVYDLVMDAPFRIRYGYLIAIVNENPHLSLVDTRSIDNEAEMLAYHKENIAAGYEGTMIRHGNSGYAVNKRSSDLLKYKDFLDEAYEVIDVLPSEARPDQGVALCSCKATGLTFSTGMKFSHSDRQAILKDKHKYIGRMAEIRFFEFTEAGIPRFPVCVGFRLDK